MDSIILSIFSSFVFYLFALCRMGYGYMNYDHSGADTKTRASGLVSVVMASYNGIAYIRESIQSVRDQSYPDRELIIVDDASPDPRAREILEDIVQMDTRIRVYYNTTNQERSSSRNKAMRYAQGEYIAFIDNDDVWLDQDKLARQINFLQQHTHIGLLGTHMRYIHPDGSLSD